MPHRSRKAKYGTFHFTASYWLDYWLLGAAVAVMAVLLVADGGGCVRLEHFPKPEDWNSNKWEISADNRNRSYFRSRDLQVAVLELLKAIYSI